MLLDRRMLTIILHVVIEELSLYAVLLHDIVEIIIVSASDIELLKNPSVSLSERAGLFKDLDFFFRELVGLGGIEDTVTIESMKIGRNDLIDVVLNVLIGEFLLDESSLRRLLHHWFDD